MPTEFERIEQIRRRLAYPSSDVALGIGDDAAVLAPNGRAQVYSVDSQVDGVHFRCDLLPALDIGYRAMAAALSDLAAMGARPRAALMALIVPKALEEDVLYRLIDGAAEAQREYDCPIVGGNLACGEQLSITTTVIGEALGSPLTRAGARSGDALYVTGELGGAALGLALLKAGEPASSPGCVARWRRPGAKIRAGLSLVGVASAAIDVSDGLLQDLTHLAQASDAGVELDLPLLPVEPDLFKYAPALGLDPYRLALSGGEDYELVFTAPAGQAPALGVRIGRITGDAGVRVLDSNRQNLSIQIAGFDHFE